MKKNGFTLVELLAMLVVIGIIMVVAVPNISGIIRNQRLDLIKNDANSMVEAAKMKVKKDRFMKKPNDGECIIFSLDYLDDNDNIVKGPNGGDYSKFDSVVVYMRKDTPATATKSASKKYKYYVRLVEEFRGKREGIHLIDSVDIEKLKTRDIGAIGDNIGLVKTDKRNEGITKVSVFASIMAYCTTVVGYYSGGNYCTQINGVFYDANGNVATEEQFNTSCY